MKTLIFISTFWLLISADAQEDLTEIKKGNKTAISNKKNTPVDLNECLMQLDNMFVDSMKLEIKAMPESMFSAKYHHGFGTWMRNNWGLWRGSKLSKYFNSLGIYHPDDMTGVIFTSYHRKLTEREINLDEQIRFYKDYWKQVKQMKTERKKVQN
jgi:hypothetical protein